SRSIRRRPGRPTSTARCSSSSTRARPAPKRCPAASRSPVPRLRRSPGTQVSRQWPTPPGARWRACTRRPWRPADGWRLNPAVRGGQAGRGGVARRATIGLSASAPRAEPMSVVRSLLLSALWAASRAACAQAPGEGPDGEAAGTDTVAVEEVQTRPGTPEDRARQAILAINPEIRIDAISTAPLDGFQEVIVGGQALYVSDDGKYLLQGSLYDIEAKRDVSQAGVAAVRRRLLATVPASERIVFAPPS